MFVIDKNQKKLFALLVDEAFITDIFSYIKSNKSDLIDNLNDEEVRTDIRKYIFFSQKYGFDYEYYIVEFVVLCFEYKFLQHYPYPNDIEEILTYPDRDDDFKLAILDDYLQDIDVNTTFYQNDNDNDLDLIV